MPELDFAIDGVEIENFGAVPTLLFGLAVTADRPVKNLMLRCQIRIEPERRSYREEECEALDDLFGDAAQWGRTPQGLVWGHVALSLPSFQRHYRTSLPLPASHDFEAAATQYCSGLTDGAVPMSFLFSGMVFYDGAEGRRPIGNTAWNREASFLLPVATWNTMIRRYRPDAVRPRPSDVLFEQLHLYRREELDLLEKAS